MSQWTCWRVRRCLSFWPLDDDDAFIWNNQPGIVRFLGRWDVGKWTRRTPGGPARSLVLWPTRYVDTHRKKRCMWGRSVGVQHFVQLWQRPKQPKMVMSFGTRSHYHLLGTYGSIYQYLVTSSSWWFNLHLPPSLLVKPPLMMPPWSPLVITFHFLAFGLTR